MLSDENKKQLEALTETWDKDETQELLILLFTDIVSYIIANPGLKLNSKLQVLNNVIGRVLKEISTVEGLSEAQSKVIESIIKKGEYAEVTEEEVPEDRKGDISCEDKKPYESEFMGSEKGSKSEKKKKDDAVEKFYHLMDSAIKKNKGKKKVETTEEIKDLVKVIDSYEGEVKVMQNIKKLLSHKKTTAQKNKVVKDFIKTVI